MTAHLRPCPSCARHVRTSESLCPFCAGVLPEAFRATAPPVLPTRRLGRAAMFAFGASLAGTPACDDTAVPAGDAAIVDGGGDTASADTSPAGLDGAPPDLGYGADIYGAPPDLGTGADIHGAPPPADAGVDGGGVAIYGAPPPRDAAPDLGNLGPVYGAPVPRG
jgi:hypothetical protein